MKARRAWVPRGQMKTRETFAFDFDDPTTMKGRSNRYGNLVATKMFV